MLFTDFIKSIFSRSKKDVLDEKKARIKALSTKQDKLSNLGYTEETWTFTMADGTVVTKTVFTKS